MTVHQRLKLSLEDLGYGLLAGRNLPFVVKTKVMLSAVRGILREERRRNCIGGAVWTADVSGDIYEGALR